MTPGPNKRKASKKKKKKAKPRDDQITTGEIDDGEVSSSASNSQHNSPLPTVNSETREHNSPARKSLTMEKTEKASDQKIEIDKGSNSQKPQEKVFSPRSSSSSDTKSRDKKKGAVIQPAPVSTKLQKKNDLIVTKSPLKQTVVHENSVNTNQLKDTGLAELVEKLVSVDEKASPKLEDFVHENSSKTNQLKDTGLPELVEKLVSVGDKPSPKSKNCLTASTVNCPFCGRGGGADRVNQHHETPEFPEKLPLLSPNPGAAEKASWKSCCGIFELCSGSSR